ncbi:MAG: uracil phosphoribosyltransferase [Prevotellaceae bacterium]|jgi:uracil phosphoribosyltransferase|nr:uracil phosphoribosyltransferase [Prevotellaceae bacterium]
MQIHHLSEQRSLLNHFIEEIRSVEKQGDSMRFRRNMERLGEVMAYEMSKTMSYKTKNVITPLGTASVNVVSDKIVIGSILRAGLPFHTGFLNYFDGAENAFVSAYRKYYDNTHFDIHVEYISAPALDGKTLILCDPMLATGSSMVLAYRAIASSHGKPAKVHIAGIIASKQAVEYVQQHLADIDVTLWVAAIDPELNDHAYIVPGIGDAGDLAYGDKL